MTPTRKKEIQAYLTGIVPPDLYDHEIKEPDDLEVKNWVIMAPVELIHKINRGRGHDAFYNATKAVFDRLAVKERAGRPPSQGRAATGIVSFDKSEVSANPTPIDPSKKQ